MIPRANRAKDDAEHWPLGYPILRLKAHLIKIGEWVGGAAHAMAAELEAQVAASWKEAVSFGTMTEGPRLDSDLMFEDCFKEMPQNLQRQQALMRKERNS